MISRTILALFLCLATATSAFGAVKIVEPSKKDILAALDAQAEAELTSWLDQYSPGSAIGHIIPVKKISDLFCEVNIEFTSEHFVSCHFVAHYGTKLVYHIATLRMAEAGWRIIADKTVDRELK